jgi:hypothetical protein
MKTINVINDFSHIKLAQERHVNELISAIENKGILGNETEIELNIEECITDYPATPKLIDYFLNHLSRQDGIKKLEVKLDGLGNKEVYILYILVLEGEFFGINDKIEAEAEIDTWRKVIDQKLREKNILLNVIYTPDNKEYHYGN